ncbi:hypothetical protein AC230_17870 [Streptomyces caatingaensis]|uniref:Uncharacterized protein n=1 Tax=Streptomyces caatingaensis TaxID=1678637 RepID=A0A0K9XED4_9ACTN|nr:hypothetical protein AC230_17870 [Streptomyces caatingaensis]
MFGLGPKGHTSVRAGGIAAVRLSGMAPGWDKVTIDSDPRSKSLFLGPFDVSPRDRRATENADEYGQHVTGEPGRYRVTAHYRGREVASTEITVENAPHADYLYRFDVYPRGGSVTGPAAEHRVHPGATAVMSVGVFSSGPKALQARSSAFEQPVALRTGTDDDPQLRSDDGFVKVYAGHIRLRRDLPEGIYPVTVSSGRGLPTVTQNLIVSGRPVSAPSDSPRWSTLWTWVGVAVVPVGLVTLGAFIVRARRCSDSGAV